MPKLCLSPENMIHAVNKVKDSGNNIVMLTDRGTMFGYQDIVVDYRGIPTMQNFGVPVVLDITHSLQQPNQNNGVTGGKPEMIETIAKAGIARINTSRICIRHMALMAPSIFPAEAGSIILS